MSFVLKETGMQQQPLYWSLTQPARRLDPRGAFIEGEAKALQFGRREDAELFGEVYLRGFPASVVEIK